MEEKHLPYLSPATFHILFALRGKELHGYAIIQAVATDSEDRVNLLTGTLYNSLKRLLNEKLIAEIRPSSRSRRRYYQLTKAGRALVEAELARYKSVVSIVTNLNKGGIVNV